MKGIAVMRLAAVVLLTVASCSTAATTGGSGASGGGQTLASGGAGGTATGGAMGPAGSGGRTGSGGQASGGAVPSGGTGGASGGSASGGRTGANGGSAVTTGGSAGSAAGGSSGTGGTVPTADAAVRWDGHVDGGGDGMSAVDTPAEDPNAVDVYLIGGQSNATGQGYSKNLPSGFTSNTNVQLYHSADINSGAAANTWITLRPASEGGDFCNLGMRFGPELGFGNAIQTLYPMRRIAIIKHAKSNTNLYSQWAPGNGPSDTSSFGPEFKTFVNTVDGGLKALRSNGLHPVIRGMLWQQGEADADAGGQNYGANLKAFIARVREQWSTPDMLFVHGYVYPASNYGTGRDIVRAGEKNVDQDSSDALATRGAFVVGTDDLELRANDPNTCLGNDKIHFGTAGQLELGKRMATKVHDKL